MQSELIMSIDQGTTSTRAMIFNQQGHVLVVEQKEFGQIYPADGWVEHDPEEIWETTLSVCRAALNKAEAFGGKVLAIGITNQRETTVVWDRETGRPIYNAIVWQDRRTADTCVALREQVSLDDIADKTGLLLDPYFSATKIAWILNHVDGARELAERGKLAFGTTDCFLIWRLTGGKVHATDASNASRTLIYNIKTQSWDQDLLALFDIPEALLPDVKDSADDYGATHVDVLGKAIPITGVAGDQQAALIGQACFAPGMIKSTYGTGCFVVLNTGEQKVESSSCLLTTIAYRLQGKVTYALEGSIFIAGAAVQWLRDSMKLIESARETEALAKSLNSNQHVYLVPAFTGLGAPYWNPHARGAIFGLTRDTGIAEIVRATLESVCYQTVDLITAMKADGVNIDALRVDGGMVANNWLLQFLADVLAVPVERPQVSETTALGAAYLAGLGAGLYADLEEVSKHWQSQQRFLPEMTQVQRDLLLDGWARAVAKVND